MVAAMHAHGYATYCGEHHHSPAAVPRPALVL